MPKTIKKTVKKAEKVEKKAVKIVKKLEKKSVKKTVKASKKVEEPIVAPSEDKAHIISEYQVKPGDTGSPEVQIALLTKQTHLIIILVGDFWELFPNADGS